MAAEAVVGEAEHRLRRVMVAPAGALSGVHILGPPVRAVLGLRCRGDIAARPPRRPLIVAVRC